MADIDMIPRSYRDAVRLRRTLRHVTIALAVVVVTGAAGNALLRWRTAGFERQAAVLRGATAQAVAASAHAAALREEHDRIARSNAQLDALRHAGELAAFAQALDGALPPTAWLGSLQWRRDLHAAPAAKTSVKAAAVPALPAIATTVEMTGQAASYDAVTAFLANLGRSRTIASVQLLSSGMNGEAQLVDFRAVVLLAWEAPR